MPLDFCLLLIKLFLYLIVPLETITLECSIMIVTKFWVGMINVTFMQMPSMK